MDKTDKLIDRTTSVINSTLYHTGNVTVDRLILTKR